MNKCHNNPLETNGKIVIWAIMRRLKELEIIMIMKISLVRMKIGKGLLKFQGKIECEPRKGQEAERYEEMYSFCSFVLSHQISFSTGI